MEVYGPNFVNSGPTTWTPADGSGAALVFTSVSGSYYRVGKLIVASFRLTYPVTADGTNANIGGLPFSAADIGTSSVYGGSAVFSSAGASAVLVAAVTRSTTAFNLLNASGAFVVNSGLSAIVIGGTITYFTA